jgi:hypothetical protein
MSKNSEEVSENSEEVSENTKPSASSDGKAGSQPTLF